MSALRSRWAAIGAAVAVTLGGGGVSLVGAAVDSGERPVTITVDPERILDTRTNLGLAGRFTSDAPRDLQVTGNVPVASGGSKTVVPPDAVAVLVNVTVVAPDSAGFLAVRPAGAVGAPTTSTVNFLTAGAVEPNAATVDLGPGGKIQLWLKTAATAGSADVLIDVVGYTVDHTHDDRYYTQAQVDASLQALRDSMPFAVHADKSSNTSLATEPAQTTVLAVTVTANVAGQVSLNALASVEVSPGTEGADVYCEILPSTAPTTGALWDGAGSAFFEKTGAANSGSISPTMQYDIGAGETITYQLRCQEEAAPLAASSFVWNASLNGIFTPNQ